MIKLEPPEGDLTRFAQPKVGSISLYYAQQNTGKRNISIDLRSSEGAAIVRALAAHVDVIIENYRPGVMDRLGLGWDTLHAANPRLVLASISGYGQTGPWANRRAYAVVIHAEMGLIESGARWRADAAGTPDDAVPVQDGMSHADVYAGLHLTTAVIAALYQRDRTGTGQWVEVDMAEALLHANDFVHWDLSPVDPGDYRPSLSPPYTPIVRTGAGASVVMGGDPAGAGVWEQYCAAMDRPDLLRRPALLPRRAPRPPGRAARDHRGLGRRRSPISTCWSTRSPRPGSRWGSSAPRARPPRPSGPRHAVRPCRSTTGAAARSGSPRRRGASPTRRPAPGGVPAYRGEHNREVLRELLGTDDATLDDWEARGVLSARVPDSE